MYASIQALGLAGLKPFLLTLLMPPLPLLLLALLGAWALRRRPALGWSLLLGSGALQWALWTPAGADALAEALLQPPAALAPGRPLAASPDRNGPALILVLGGGRVEAPEYGEVTLNALSLQRLRYGVALSRQSGLPLAFSGGRGPGMDEGQSEGALAARIAREEYGHPLAWVEDRSRDTRENADFSVERLRGQGIGRLVLVTHDLHEPRALRNVARARDAAGLSFELVAAPVGAPGRQTPREWSDFLPSAAGIARSRYVLHEWLGLRAGA